MKKIICGLLAIIGVIIAVETANDSENELLCRGIGAAVFAVFSYLGGWWDTEKHEKTPDNGGSEEQKPTTNP